MCVCCLYHSPADLAACWGQAGVACTVRLAHPGGRHPPQSPLEGLGVHHCLLRMCCAGLKVLPAEGVTWVQEGHAACCAQLQSEPSSSRPHCKKHKTQQAQGKSARRIATQITQQSACGTGPRPKKTQSNHTNSQQQVSDNNLPAACVLTHLDWHKLGFMPTSLGFTHHAYACTHAMLLCRLRRWIVTAGMRVL